MNAIYRKYQNVFNMLLDRKYEIPQQLTFDEFQKRYMNNNDHIYIHGDNYTIIIFRLTTLKTKIFNKAIKNVKTHKIIAIISDKNIIKRHISIINKYDKHDIELIILERFNFHLTKHILTPKHILHRDSSFLEKNSTYSKDDIPRMLITSPLSKWYGAKVGDVFEIHRELGKENPLVISFRLVVSD
jgi:DNA-directed RNA polymerase subunit H (RpoH/RPB5)